MPTPNCCYCGQFINSADYDVEMPFGNSNSLEPPDEDFFCSRCSKKQEEYLVEKYKNSDSMFLNCVFSKAELRAVKRLGMVVAGPRLAAWAESFKPECVPPNYKIWDIA